jgi:hypothetical protein
VLELVVVAWSRLRVLDALVVDISDTLSRAPVYAPCSTPQALQLRITRRYSLLAPLFISYLITASIISLFDKGFVLVVLVLYWRAQAVLHLCTVILYHKQ